MVMPNAVFMMGRGDGGDVADALGDESLAWNGSSDDSGDGRDEG